MISKDQDKYETQNASEILLIVISGTQHLNLLEQNLSRRKSNKPCRGVADNAV